MTTATLSKPAAAARPPTFSGLEAYLRLYGRDMGARLAMGTKPLYDPEAEALSPEVQSLFAHASFRPKAAQAVAVEAICRVLERSSVAVGLGVGEMGTGKCQPLDSKVLTPSGWKRMGDMQIGDRVIDSEGGWTKVVGVFPQGEKDIYRVTFSDGSSTECCDEHLWTVNTPLRRWRGNPNRLLTLRQIMDEGLTDAAGNHQHFIPMVAPVEFDCANQTPLPLDPYLLGAMLGDGTLGGLKAHFTTADPDMATEIARLLPPGVVMSQCSPGSIEYRFRAEARTTNAHGHPLPNALDEGLRRLELTCGSAAKFIPDRYLTETVEKRVAILQGLLDTDGTTPAAKGRGVEYVTVSPRLAANVRELVQSLGGVASIAEKMPTYTYLGARRQGQKAYRLYITLPPNIVPFRLARKASAYAPATKYGPRRCIVAVTSVGRKPAQCIKVAAPNQLYVTDDYIVTHNTPMGVWTAIVMAKKMGRPIRTIIQCPNQLVLKWKKHCELLSPGCKAVIIKSFADLQGLKRAGDPKVMEFWIVSRDKAKLSYAFRLGVNVREKVFKLDLEPDDKGQVETTDVRVQTFYCPKCGNKVTTDKDGKTSDAGIDYFARPQRNGTYKLRARRICRAKVMKRVFEAVRNADGKATGAAKETWVDTTPLGEPILCGEPLWQANTTVADGGEYAQWDERTRGGSPSYKRGEYALPRPGVFPRRMAPAEYIARARLHFDLYLPDEVHELAGEGSLQGHSFAMIAKRSRWVVPLTGTLVGGYAHNILHVLWRTMAGRLIREGMKHSPEGHKEFIKLFGVLKEEKHYKKSSEHQNAGDLLQGKGKLVSTREKALPGISPLLYTRFLLPHAVFLRLLSMSGDLPPFREFVQIVPLLPEQAIHLDAMSQAFKLHCANMKAARLPVRAWSEARSTFLRWLDRPWPSQTVYDWDYTGLGPAKRIEAFHVSQLPEETEYPKERRLRRLIQLQRARGRKVWVFTEMTGQRWDVTPRLKAYLERHGLRVCVLPTQSAGGPKPEDREEWISKRQHAVDVFISNPTLVKTGLDLYSFATLMFYYCGDSTYTLRQASRRAWRLGQKNACEVYYLCYGQQMKVAVGGRPVDDTVAKYTSVQSAALTLMAQKMEAALALEGDFSAEGLAAMSGGDDTASQLAKVIAGSLVVGDPRDAFAKYRARLEKAMPSVVGLAPIKTEEAEAAPALPTFIPGALLASLPERELQGTYSGDLIPQGKVRRPVEVAGRFWTVVGTMADEYSVCELVPAERWLEPSAPYHGQRLNQRGYRGTQVTFKDAAFVLGDEAIIKATGATAPAPRPYSPPAPPPAPAPSPPPPVQSLATDATDALEQALGKAARKDPALAALLEQAKAQIAPPPPVPTPAPRPAPAPTVPAPAPSKAPLFEPPVKVIAARKDAATRAVAQVMGAEPSDSIGECRRFGETWVHLVSKRRSTFRDRNLATLRALPSNGPKLIVFIEEPEAQGPADTFTRTSVDGIPYHVSHMTLADWDTATGQRRTRALPTLQGATP